MARSNFHQLWDTALYNMNKLEGNLLNTVEKCGYFLLAGGYDYRAYEILRKCSMQDIHPRNILIFDFTEFLEGLST